MKVKRTKSDSAQQRLAEIEIREMLTKKLRFKVVPQTLTFKDGVAVNVDVYSEKKKYIAEICARIGGLKVAQKHKAMNDAFKLIYAEKRLGGKWSKQLIFASKAAAGSFLGNGWHAGALRKFGIQILIVEPSDHMRVALEKAQKEQNLIAEGLSD